MNKIAFEAPIRTPPFCQEQKAQNFGGFSILDPFGKNYQNLGITNGGLCIR
jgi:hypothetical protein